MSRYRLVAAAIIPILVLTACNAASPTPVPSSAAPSVEASPSASASAEATPAASQGTKFKGISVNLLTFNGPQVAEPLQRRAPDWEQLTGGHVNVVAVGFQTIYDKALLDASTKTNSFDGYVFDPQWLGDFVSPGYLLDLSDRVKADSQLQWDDIGPFFRDFNATYNGKVYTIPLDGDFHMVYYRSDILAAPPKTWDDVLAVCAKLNDPPRMYGFVVRGEKGNGIRYDWQSFMLAERASVVKDPEGGDYTVTINSPQAKAALDLYIDLLKRCGPPNYGSLGQGDVIQLLATGKAAQGDVVTAAFASFEDPNKSAVVGKLETVPLPRARGGASGAVIGNWNAVIPKNAPDAQKKAALAFSRWFLTYDAQRAFALAGGIPNRSDVFTSDLAKEPRLRWMPAYLATQKFAKQELGYAEGAQVEQNPAHSRSARPVRERNTSSSVTGTTST